MNILEGQKWPDYPKEKIVLEGGRMARLSWRVRLSLRRERLSSLKEESEWCDSTYRKSNCHTALRTLIMMELVKQCLKRSVSLFSEYLVRLSLIRLVLIRLWLKGLSKQFLINN